MLKGIHSNATSNGHKSSSIEDPIQEQEEHSELMKELGQMSSDKLLVKAQHMLRLLNQQSSIGPEFLELAKKYLNEISRRLNIDFNSSNERD